MPTAETVERFIARVEFNARTGPKLDAKRVVLLGPRRAFPATRTRFPGGRQSRYGHQPPRHRQTRRRRPSGGSPRPAFPPQLGRRRDCRHPSHLHRHLQSEGRQHRAGLQQAQADKLDHWNFYQARNLREELAKATALQFRLQAQSQPAALRAQWDDAAVRYETLAREQAQKKEELRQQALADQKTYDSLNFRDDQFDLSDAAIAIAISLLAITALTQFWWLFGLSMVPAVFGMVMGTAGIAGWALHPEVLTRLLG